jgi:hypothetical protein
MKKSSHTILDKFPEPNPDPAVPNSLLDTGIGSLPTGEKAELNQLSESKHGKVPRYAACRAKDQHANIMFYNKKQHSYTGELARNLPRAEWPNHTIPKSNLPWAKLTIGAGIMLAGYILAIESKSPAGVIAGLIITIVGAILEGGIFGYWLDALRRQEELPSTLECNRPPLGLKTKQKIISHLKTGWEEVHLLWPAENNWHTVQEKGTKEDHWQETCLLIIGEKGYDLTIAEKIADRTQ